MSHGLVSAMFPGRYAGGNRSASKAAFVNFLFPRRPDRPVAGLPPAWWPAAALVTCSRPGDLQPPWWPAAALVTCSRPGDLQPLRGLQPAGW